MTFREKCTVMSYFPSIRSSPILNNFSLLLKSAIPKFTCFCPIWFQSHFHPDPKHNKVGITISKIPLNHSACNQTPCITHNTRAGIVSPPYCPSRSMNGKQSCISATSTWSVLSGQFSKHTLFTRNVILLATTGPLDVCILFFSNVVTSLFERFFQLCDLLRIPVNFTKTFQ